MTEIDSAAFEAGEESCNFSQDNLSAAGSSTAVHFSDTLGRVYVTARARLLSARPQPGHTQPALTVVVEDSADGSSWATVATFTFTASDEQPVAIDSPRAYLRARWTGVVGVWAVDVDVKSLSAASSGGGGSLPTELTVNSGRLEFDASTVDPSHQLFAIQAPADFALSVEVNDDGTPGDVQWTNGQNNIHEIGSGSIRLFGTFDGADNLQLYATTVFTGGTLFQIEQSKVILKGVHAPPDDADLASSSFGLWLDDTPGATKLMVKAKDSGGTVRTAAINLT